MELDKHLKLDWKEVEQLRNVDTKWLTEEAKRWKAHREDYNRKMASLIKERDAAQTTKAPSALASSSSSSPAARKSRGDTESIHDQKMKALREKYQRLFLDPFFHDYDPRSDLLSPLQQPPPDLLCLARVIYTECYQAEKERIQRVMRKQASDAATGSGDGAALAVDAQSLRPPSASLSFVWNVAGDILIYYKRCKSRR